MCSLELVAAICDNDSKSCRGDGTIHSICAVSFIGYNFMMAMSSFSKHNDGVSTHGVALCPFCQNSDSFILFGFTDKHSVWGDQTPLAIVEWTDVGLILVWTVSFLITNSPKVRVGICKIDSDETQSMTTMKAALLVNDPSKKRRQARRPVLQCCLFLHAFPRNDCSIVVLCVPVRVSRVYASSRSYSEWTRTLHFGHVGMLLVIGSREMVMGGSVCAILVPSAFTTPVRSRTMHPPDV